MRVRLRSGSSSTVLAESLPVAGRVLHPESNRAEWAIVALDAPVSVEGLAAELLWLRPAVAGARVGDPTDTPVHVAVVTGVGEGEGRPVYRLGELLGQLVCAADPGAEPSPASDPGRIR